MKHSSGAGAGLGSWCELTHAGGGAPAKVTAVSGEVPPASSWLAMANKVR